jgi:uncharacterized protein (DUF169 family)
MKSRLITELQLQYHPVAVIFSDTRPAEARQIRENHWGCVMGLYALVIKRGITAVFDRRTYGCIGAGVGLCFGNTYRDNREWMINLLAREERYFKTEELVAEFMDEFPYVDLPRRYVVFKPLPDVDPTTEEPALISIPANADQLSALAALINFRRHGNNHITAPFAAGCQSVCVMPCRESRREYPRAVIGNLDLSSRKILPVEILTFTIPFRTFLEMEEDVPASFLRIKPWTTLVKRQTKNRR